MPGRSRSVLASAGHNAYIVKCPRRLECPNALANEIIGTELMKAIGLPTPDWHFVTYGTALICPSGIIDGADSASACHLHFASQVPQCQEGGRLFAVMPSALLAQVSNWADFVGAFVFDAWGMSGEARQAIFVEDLPSETFRAVFIDHGHLFGGQSRKLQPDLSSRFYVPGQIYDLFDTGLVNFWILRMCDLVPHVLSNVMKRIPMEWLDRDLDCWQDELLLGLNDLPSNVEFSLSKLAVQPYTRSTNAADAPSFVKSGLMIDVAF